MSFSSQEFKKRRSNQRELGKVLIIVGAILLFINLVTKGSMYLKEIMILLTFIIMIVGIVILFKSRSLPTKEAVLVARQPNNKGRLTIPQLMEALDIDEDTATSTLNKLAQEGHARREETGGRRSGAVVWVFPDIVVEFGSKGE
jgi:hypothetical protein